MRVTNIATNRFATIVAVAGALMIIYFVRVYSMINSGPCGWNNGGSWATGLAFGPHPFDLHFNSNASITCAEITDMPAGFVADTFILEPSEVGGVWNMFFEIMDNESQKGSLGMATSHNLKTWTYQGVILKESYHLSYPFVVRTNGKVYMIPETNQKQEIRMYEAVDDSLKHWRFKTTLVDGMPYVDSSMVFYDGVWYMWSWTRNPNHLHLFYAEDIEGPWIPHPMSPLDNIDKKYRRPGGRPVVVGGDVLRYAQDGSLSDFTYGSSLFAITVKVLTPELYEEEVVKPLTPDGSSGWISHRMHTVDPWMLSDGTWVAGIDGDTQYNIPITTFVLKWLGLLMGLCACLIWYRCNIHANRLRIWRTLPSNDSWDGGFNRKTLMSGWDTRDSSMRRVNSAPSRGDTAGGTCATS